jgi:hypothetical protein
LSPGAPAVLAKWLGCWFLATLAACAVVHRVFALEVDASHPRAVVASVWSAGQLVAQAVLAHAGERDPQLDAALAAHPDGTLVYESIVGEGPVLARPEAVFAMSFLQGRDGLRATIGDRTAYVTPDELLSRQAYDKGVEIHALQLSIGLDTAVALAVLSDRLGVTVRDLVDRATLRRVRVLRTVPDAPPRPPVAPETLTDADVRAAAIAAGAYLARGVDAEGRFRYLVDAPTNRTLAGYDWPRHAGATYFLAQAADLSGDAAIGGAALRAAAFLRDRAMLRCGAYRCVGDGSRVDVGSAALTVMAFVEVARTHLDADAAADAAAARAGSAASFASMVPEITAFLRAQQRPDGEFMHEYDRDQNRPVDVQLLYYSGEAALALARAHALLGDPRDLDAATRALAHLVGSAWSFFGSRYYWGEEHWTCQAMGDLWSRAPDRRALAFCLDWQAFTRKLQYGPGDTLLDADGAFGVGPVVTPRLTPAGSRTEAAVATMEAGRLAGVAPAELDALDRQIRRSLALLIRHQFQPGPAHLFTDPAAVAGAIPGSEVDWQLRIDYAQHAGSAMVRWLARGAGRAPTPPAL